MDNTIKELLNINKKQEKINNSIAETIKEYINKIDYDIKTYNLDLEATAEDNEIKIDINLTDIFIILHKKIKKESKNLKDCMKKYSVEKEKLLDNIINFIEKKYSIKLVSAEKQHFFNEHYILYFKIQE